MQSSVNQVNSPPLFPSHLMLVSYRAVIEMERGESPDVAAKIAMSQIAVHYPDFSGALVAVNLSGQHGEQNLCVLSF